MITGVLNAVTHVRDAITHLPSVVTWFPTASTRVLERVPDDLFVRSAVPGASPDMFCTISRVVCTLPLVLPRDTAFRGTAPSLRNSVRGCYYR